MTIYERPRTTSDAGLSARSPRQTTWRRLSECLLEKAGVMFVCKADVEYHTLVAAIGLELGGLNFVVVQPGAHLAHC
jgi:hypothetical protein